jgi:hypothetical protein
MNCARPGLQVLDEHKGQDITQLFEGGEGGHAHSKAAHLLLERFYRGDLVGEGAAAEGLSEEQRILRAQATAQENVVDESKPLLSQVCDSCAQAWCAKPSLFAWGLALSLPLPSYQLLP